MALLGSLLIVAVAFFSLLRHLSTKRDGRELWRSIIAIGLLVGTLRATLACVGQYGVEHTGGPLQIPAYVLSMLALPEAIVFGRRRGPTTASTYLSLALLLIVTTMVVVGIVGVAVHAARGRRDR